MSGGSSGGTDWHHKVVIPYCYSTILYIFITYLLKVEEWSIYIEIKIKNKK